VITLVSDIRKYTSMSETLPGEKFSRFVKDWFRECCRLVQLHGGAVDKCIGDAIMCYWQVPDRDNPAKEAGSSLAVARGYQPIGMFEPFKMGIVYFGIGMAYNALLVRRLPERGDSGNLTSKYQLAPYLTEVRVPAASRLIGRGVKRSPYDEDSHPQPSAQTRTV